MIFERIRDIISQQLDVDKNNITMDTSFQELKVDSLEFFQIIIDMEEEFNVQIEDAESISTIREAVDFITASIKNNK